MTVSFEDRTVTLNRQVVVYHCDNPGCSSEIDGCSSEIARIQRHPYEDECFRSHGWLEIVSDPLTPGSILCSWKCVASYGTLGDGSRISTPDEEPLIE